MKKKKKLACMSAFCGNMSISLKSFGGPLRSFSLSTSSGLTLILALSKFSEKSK